MEFPAIRNVFFALLTVIATSGLYAQVQISLWEGTAHAIPLENEVAEKPVLRYRVVQLPTQGVLLRQSVELTIGTELTIADLDAWPLIYRHTTIGDLSNDSFPLEADIEDDEPPEIVTLTVSPQAPPFTTVSDLILWLDGSLESSVRNAADTTALPGERVARWNDRSALSNDATQGVDLQRPLMNSSIDARGHLQGVRFSGGTEFLESGAFIPTTATPLEFTYIAALRPSLSDNDYDGIIASNGARSGLFLSGSTILGRGFNSSNQNGWTVEKVDYDQWVVATSRVRTDAALGNELFVDGTTREVNEDVTDLLNIAGSKIGDTSSDLDEALDGVIGEVALISAALPWADRNRVERYLRSKWELLEIHDRTSVTADISISLQGATPAALLGGSGMDLLSSGSGDDILYGGPGDDILSGGAGRDRFLFLSVLDGNDRITDYSRTDLDEIDLTGALGEGSDHGFDECIQIRVVGPDSIIDVDVDGASTFNPPDMSILVEGITDLSAPDLVTGLEASAVDLESITIELVDLSTALEMGIRREIRSVGHYLGGVSRELKGRQLKYSDSQGLVAIDHRGWVLPHRPGTTTISAEFHGSTATLPNIVIDPTPDRIFWELDQIDPGTDDSGAYQGIAIAQNFVYSAANFLNNSKIFKLTRNFVPVDENVITPPGYGTRTHIGAIDFYDGFLWATFLDLDSWENSSVPSLLGLAKIDPDTLDLLFYQDLTGVYGYLDALTFHNGQAWLPTNPATITRLPMTPNGVDISEIVSYSYQAGIGDLQGIRIHDNKVYVVPESTTSLTAAIGIAVFDLDTLVEDFNADSAIRVADHLRETNIPRYLHAVAYPASNPDHKSLSFDPDELAVVYLPFVPGGDTLVKLELERCSGTDPDNDGDGICVSTDCAPTDIDLWASPSTVTNLRFSSDTGFHWDLPDQPGSASSLLLYDTVRWDSPDLSAGAVCIESNDGTDRSAIDLSTPAPEQGLYYLVRAENPCGTGTLGSRSGGLERTGISCP